MRQKATLKTIPVEHLARGRYQPRVQFDEEKLQELADSIKNAGLLQPIVVRPLTDDKYEIIAGERRWRATQLAGLDEINCLVKSFTDEEAAEAATIENISRVDLNPIEEARAYQRLIDEFRYVHEEVAATVGKSRTAITNSLRLLKLDSRVQDFIVRKDLSEGHAKILVTLDPLEQFTIAKKAIKHGWSARKIEQVVKKLKSNPASKSDRDPDVKRLEKMLTEKTGCPVEIDFSSGSGQLKIDFYDLDVLQGLIKKMGYKER